MKKLLFAVLTLGLLWACSNSESQKSEEKSVATTEAKPKKIDGGKVYKQYCVTCHGLYGDMGASGAYNLQTSELELEERINVITNGRNTMVGLGNLLNEAQIKAVAEYTFTLKNE